MIMEYIRSFVGTAPSSFEWLEYVAAVAFFLLLMKILVETVTGFARFFGPR